MSHQLGYARRIGYIDACGEYFTVRSSQLLGQCFHFRQMPRGDDDPGTPMRQRTGNGGSNATPTSGHQGPTTREGHPALRASSIMTASSRIAPSDATVFRPSLAVASLGYPK